MNPRKVENAPSDILEHYDDYYDDSIIGWRQLGAKHKASNIIEMCSRIEHDTVLDVGAGEGSVSFELAKAQFSRRITCLEISSSAIAYIKKNKPPEGITEKRYDGLTIPFGDNQFDLAIASHVLEHVEHERAFIKEVARVAKHLFVEVPLEDTLRSPATYTPNPVGHINFYNRKTIRKLLESSGLEVLQLRLFSTPYEVFAYSGAVGGALKFSVCQAAALFGDKFASTLFTYHCGVLCRTVGSSDSN